MRHIQVTQSITNRESPVLEAYFNEVARLGLLTPAEEIELALKIKQGDQLARERLIKANLRFVVSVAKKYQYQGLPLSDLIAEGNMGLIRAAMDFDETRGFKFISYAVWWIRQTIMGAIAEQTRTIRIPDNSINLLTLLTHTAERLEAHLERRPTDAELAESANVPEEKVRDTHYWSARAASYDAPVPGAEYEGSAMINLIAGEDPNVEMMLAEQENETYRNRLLEALPVAERQVITMSFGIGRDCPLLVKDIAAFMGMNQTQVRQLKENALESLRGHLKIA